MIKHGELLHLQLLIFVFIKFKGQFMRKLLICMVGFGKKVYFHYFI